MGYLGATLTQVFTRARGADVSLRDITIAQMGNGDRECEWHHAPEACGGFGEFWRKSVELRTRHRTRRVDFGGSLKPDEFARYGRCTRWWGCRRKSQNRKNVYLSPYVEESLNSKVLKWFRTWTKKSLRVFRVSGFLCYMYICYEHSMYVSHICIMGMVHIHI